MLQYIRDLWRRRKQRRKAVRLLLNSGVIRSANHGIRYTMTPKELIRLMDEERIP